MTNKDPNTDTYVWYNHNPKNRKTGDCVIRAISKALDQTWDDTLDGLVEISHATKYNVTSSECYTRYLQKHGYIKHKQLRKSDNTKYTGEEFCHYLAYSGVTNPVIAHIGSHHISLFGNFDGEGIKCHDIWNPNEYCVGVFWITSEDYAKLH